MKTRLYRLAALLLALLLVVGLAACSGEEAYAEGEYLLEQAEQELADALDEGGYEAETTQAPEEGVETDAAPDAQAEATQPVAVTEAALDPNGSYTTKEDVALYLYTYGELPGNFITKKEAKALGWSGGSLEPYAPGKCIGGDRFGNYESLLPEDKTYHECDINTLGADSRGAERLVFSDDGLIYYTGDHYESFTLLYGEE